MVDIARLYDPSLVVAVGEAAVKGKAEDATYGAMLACAAVEAYKRRLGGVSGAELREDKRTARRAGYQLYKVARVYMPGLAWRDVGSLVEPEHRAAAAVVSWDSWLSGVVAAVGGEAVYAATWLIRVDLRSSFVRSIAINLDDCAKNLVRLRGEIGNR